MQFRILCFIALTVACSTQPDGSAAQLDGIRVESVTIGNRDQKGRAPLTVRATNTTNQDLPGMQIAFQASDREGTMGPFWIPEIGTESSWALKSGETRELHGEVVGFGVRDVRNAKAVDVRILGARVGSTVELPSEERRAIFSAIVGCEDSANEAAAKLYPDDLSLPGKEQLERMRLRSDYAEPLREACLSELRSSRNLSRENFASISLEGVEMRWPPLGSN